MCVELAAIQALGLPQCCNSILVQTDTANGHILEHSANIS